MTEICFEFGLDDSLTAMEAESLDRESMYRPLPGPGERPLEGKVAVVTGASSGIGEATARAFAAQGAKVTLAARRGEELERVAADIEAEGGEALAVPTDMLSFDQVEAMVAAAIERFGDLDIAFNNVGTGPPEIPLDQHTHESWMDQVVGNMNATFYALRHEIPSMKRKGGGAIVNTSSIFGVVGAPLVAPYVAAKHGVVGLTKAAALELAPDNIRVNAIAPAVVDTPMYRNNMGATPEGREALRQLHPLKRVSVPAEAAALVAYLAGDHAGFVTGTTVTFDGGWAAQ